MFGFGKKIQGSAVEFRIKGMHCAACSMNIDGALEELDGVIGATTSYAKGTTQVVYDAAKIQPARMKKAIEDLEYSVVE